MVCRLYVHCVLTKLWELLSLSVRTTKIEIWYQLIVNDLKKGSTHIFFPNSKNRNKKLQLLPSLQPIGALSHKALLSVATPVREQTPTREGDDDDTKILGKMRITFLENRSSQSTSMYSPQTNWMKSTCCEPQRVRTDTNYRLILKGALLKPDAH